MGRTAPSRSRLGGSLRQAARPRQAAPLVTSSVHLATDVWNSLAWASNSGSALLYAACAFCECSEAARHDQSLDPERRSRAAQRYLRRAMESLQKARETNLFKQQVFIEALKTTDPDLEPLRGSAEFKRFLGELEREAEASL